LYLELRSLRNSRCERV